MSFDLEEQIRIVNPHSNIDELYGTYPSKELALESVVPELRRLGRTVGILEGGGVKEYWFRYGLTDAHLIPKGNADIIMIEGNDFEYRKNPNNNTAGVISGDIALNGWITSTNFGRLLVYVSGDVTNITSWNVLDNIEF